MKIYNLSRELGLIVNFKRTKSWEREVLYRRAGEGAMTSILEISNDHFRMANTQQMSMIFFRLVEYTQLKVEGNEW